MIFQLVGRKRCVTDTTRLFFEYLILDISFQVDPENGKIVFVDHNTNRQTLTDPRLAFAVEETPNFVSEIRQRFDASTKALEILHGKDLSGKVAIITGANAGIGFETARSLAFHQCEVVFACR